MGLFLFCGRDEVRGGRITVSPNFCPHFMALLCSDAVTSDRHGSRKGELLSFHTYVNPVKN